MELTHQQIHALLDRIRQDTGQAIDPARITDLLEQEELLAEAESSLELSNLEDEMAQDALNQAKTRAAETAARQEADDRIADLARGRVITMRRALGVLRTATGYVTVEQAREARDLAAEAGAYAHGNPGRPE